MLPVGGEKGAAEPRVLPPASAGDLGGGDLLVAEEPFPLLGDAYGKGGPPLPVDVFQDRGGGEARDLVFTGDTAKEDGNDRFGHGKAPYFLKDYKHSILYHIPSLFARKNSGWEKDSWGLGAIIYAALCVFKEVADLPRDFRRF